MSKGASVSARAPSGIGLSTGASDALWQGVADGVIDLAKLPGIVLAAWKALPGLVMGRVLTGVSLSAQAGLGGELASAGLGDSPADDGRVGAGVEGGAVGGQLAAEVGYLLAHARL